MSESRFHISFSRVFKNLVSKPIIILLSYMCFRWLILWHIWCLYVLGAPTKHHSTDSTVISWSCFLTASVMWHSYVSHAIRGFLKENLLITSLIHLNVSSSFIHPFPDDTIEHWILNSSCRAFNSGFVAAKTMKGLIFFS